MLASWSRRPVSHDAIWESRVGELGKNSLENSPHVRRELHFCPEDLSDFLSSVRVGKSGLHLLLSSTNDLSKTGVWGIPGHFKYCVQFALSIFQFFSASSFCSRRIARIIATVPRPSAPYDPPQPAPLHVNVTKDGPTVD